MAYKPVGIETDSTFPPRVMDKLGELFVSVDNYNGLLEQVTVLEAAPEPVEVFRFRSTASLNFTSTTFANATGFVWTAAPNTNYEVRYKLRVQSTVDTGDIKFQFTGPAGATVTMDSYGGGSGLVAEGGGSFKTSSRSGFGVSSTGFGTIAANPQIVFIELDVQVGATGGVVQLQAAQNTADAVASTLVIGSGFDGAVV